MLCGKCGETYTEDTVSFRLSHICHALAKQQGDEMTEAISAYIIFGEVFAGRQARGVPQRGWRHSTVAFGVLMVCLVLPK